MINEIIELKKIYYKMQSETHYADKLIELGVFPDESIPVHELDMELETKLGELIIEFDKKEE